MRENELLNFIFCYRKVREMYTTQFVNDSPSISTHIGHVLILLSEEEIVKVAGLCSITAPTTGCPSI